MMFSIAPMRSPAGLATGRALHLVGGYEPADLLALQRIIRRSHDALRWKKWTSPG
jgi:hypothetical protein